MSVQAAEGKLVDVRRRLAARRRELEALWQDEQADAFAREVLDPLDQALSRAINAMSEIDTPLRRARRETE